MTAPRESGYYWAKLLHPSYSDYEDEDWRSVDWEIVQLNANNGEAGSAEEFSVQVFGVPVTQWPHNFEWGPPVSLEGKPL
jgi:hypothetical protein